MVGFIATYVDVVATLEENDFKLKPPAEGSTPGIWEKRDLAIAWRCAHAATCGAICLTLFLGDPNIVFGPVAPLFWTSLFVGSIALGQVLIESTFLRNRTSRAMKAVLVWYDLAFDTTIFEFHHFVTLIGAGTIVEFAYSGAATQIFVRLGLEDLLAALVGSPGWLIASVALGLLMGTITLWSTKDTIDKIRSMYVGVIKESISSPTKKDAEKASEGTPQASSSATTEPEGTADRLLGGTLGIVGFLMKLINVTVGDTKGWFFLILGILNRIVQVLLAIYSIYATNSLLAIDELVTYYMLLAASYGIVVGSSIMAVVETARWVVMSQNIKGFFTPGSSMMKFYAILTLVYDTLFAVFTDVTAAFTFALAITYCLLGYTCETTTLVGGAFLWLIITFYFASLQSYNLLQLAFSGPDDVDA